jgi:hypothetical protein
VGCHDADALLSPSPSPSSAFAFLEIEETMVSTEFVLRARVRVGEGLNLPSAFVARVILPVGVDSARDVSRIASVMRASNVVDGDVKMAGAAASGIDELFAIMVRATSRESIDGTRLVIDELTDLKGNDLRVVLRTASRLLDARRR